MVQSESYFLKSDCHLESNSAQCYGVESTFKESTTQGLWCLIELCLQFDILELYAIHNAYIFENCRHSFATT